MKNNNKGYTKYGDNKPGEQREKKPGYPGQDDQKTGEKPHGGGTKTGYEYSKR